MSRRQLKTKGIQNQTLKSTMRKPKPKLDRMDARDKFKPEEVPKRSNCHINKQVKTLAIKTVM